jgi:hypothetical protein
MPLRPAARVAEYGCAYSPYIFTGHHRGGILMTS